MIPKIVLGDSAGASRIALRGKNAEKARPGALSEVAGGRLGQERPEPAHRLLGPVFGLFGHAREIERGEVGGRAPGEAFTDLQERLASSRGGARVAGGVSEQQQVVFAELADDAFESLLFGELERLSVLARRSERREARLAPTRGRRGRRAPGRCGSGRSVERLLLRLG